VNYRRNDSEGEAGRLFDELAKHFGEDAVFMDVAGIGPGQDFRKAIDQSVASCTVLLAVIGQQWLDSREASGARRLDDPGDFVRIELASALRTAIPVVPVLVRGSRMPRAEELPDDLKDLAYRNAVELTHARWKSDIQLLIHALRPYMGAPIDPQAGKIIPKAAAPPAQDSRRTETGPVSEPIDPQKVDRLARELAGYLGPIAHVIVKRAVQGCSSVEQLCSVVAREIISDTDRAKFIRICRS
jgi:hypothetical protein